MNDQVAWIKDLNRRILESIASKRVEAEQQLAEAIRRVDALRQGIVNLDAKRDQLLATEEMQLLYLGSTQGEAPRSDAQAGEASLDDDGGEETISTAGPVREKGKLKARIGEQRYLVLSVPRQFGEVTLNFIIFRSALPERRVRDAVYADVALGVLEKGPASSHGEDSYRLTEVGMDLMQRFDDYRRQRGLPIPSLAAIEEVGRPGIAPNGEEAIGDTRADQSFPARPGLVWEMSNP